jgi:cyclopropane fatty-acyl-phospholipid synthase-like methyltransferase
MASAVRFDTDSKALAERAALNANNAAVSLEQWWWSLLPRKSYGSVLDIGCGLGKQMFFLADALPAAEITGFDISPDSVESVNRRVAKEGHGTRMRALQLGLDTCLESLPKQGYDLIVSAYAIYYAKDVPGLLKGLRGCLKPGGLAIIMGYGAGSNDELYALINASATKPGDKLERVEDYLSPGEVDGLRSSYAKVTTERLANHVTFTSTADVLSWWRNHNSYRAAVDADVERLLDEKIAASGRFELAKNVFAVMLHA